MAAKQRLSEEQVNDLRKRIHVYESHGVDPFELRALLDEATHWREVVAAASTIEISVVTQFSPKGFAKAIGGHRWFYVKCGDLVLARDGDWIFTSREESTKQRMKYAHKTMESALQALTNAVAPTEPAAEELWRPIIEAEKVKK